ncbi:pimeloyl-ACP methyl ester carboxylesterase [Saonia flava]|uniref:Pimeloyl-ACP methyl ester carboxylesterase n=1 Tax=Saonia flava TaxID=523696 RepID=A0A846QW86_9FLAO|nr:alpha/beta hydrolase [Saonia flava]NJB72591.1 pimeloyl-ACP methyl ester carboxylesterase [Saonia flava]
MRHFYFTFLVIFYLSFYMRAQSQDTLVDVGGYKMHFKIIKGKGTPILFEAGAGSDASVWDNILEKIHKVTGTTLITYDRSGFGQSELNPNLNNDSDFGIENGIKELETGLSKLGFDNEIVLVSHSYGGLYNLLYTRKHPKKVKSVILLDVTLNDFWNEELLTMRDNNVDISTIDKPSGDYYFNANFNETMRYVRNIHFPENLPIINIFPENSFPGFPEVLSNRWRKLHIELGDHKDNVTNIIAKGSGHAVFQDNPSLIINAIIKAYSKTLDEVQQNELLQKALDIAIELSIEAKKTEMENKHSEHDLNEWGYSFLRNEELDKALEILKLNIMLFPESWNAYDSYGEALSIANKKAEAIEMYEKSIELNPENENGKKVLLQMKQE